MTGLLESGSSGWGKSYVRHIEIVAEYEPVETVHVDAEEE